MCLIGPLGIGKRYAARVFHNWSKEARGTVLPRSDLQGFSLGVGLQMHHLNAERDFTIRVLVVTKTCSPC